MGKAALDATVAFLIGAAGGAVFYLVGAPLPWTLGSLAAAALVAVSSGGRWLMPAPVREVARPVVGILAGSAFTPEVVASVGEWWGAIVFVAVYTLIASALGWLFFRKLCRLDPVTAYFASTPGGLGELTLLGGALGGSMRTLVTIHSVRIVAVVFCVPLFLQLLLGGELQGTALSTHAQDAVLLDWLILIGCGVAGYLVARLLRMRGGAMIIAMLLSAAVHGAGLTQLLPPNWLVAVVQVVIGAVAGARFAGIRWLELRNTVIQALVWACVLLVTAIGAAALGAMLFARPFAALVLAVAPGGMAEMTIISYALGIETAFVVTSQVCRTFFVLTCAPLFFRLLGIKPATSSVPAVQGSRKGRPPSRSSDEPKPD